MEKFIVITTKVIEPNEDEAFILERRMQTQRLTYGLDYISTCEFFSRDHNRVTFLEESKPYIVPCIFKMEEHFNSVKKELQNKNQVLENKLKELQEKYNNLEYNYKYDTDKQFKAQEIKKKIDQELLNCGIKDYS